MVSNGLLNKNQRRHVETYLRLLLDDLRELEGSRDGASDGLRDAPVSAALWDTATAVRRLGQALHLSVERPRDHRRRVSAVANGWVMRTYEIDAAALAAYGAVDPALEAVLSPLVSALRERLAELAAAANGSSRG